MLDRLIAMLDVELDRALARGCRICGWATLPGATLCVGCLDIQEWSRVNRAFCDLLHRPRPLEAAASPWRPVRVPAEDLVLTA